MVACEFVREKAGMHLCDKRRPTLEIQQEFRWRLDADQLSDTDLLWTAKREEPESVEKRCEAFLEWLQGRPEESIAVVSHHHFLMCLFNVVLAPTGHAALLAPFGTAEMRSVVLDFSMWLPEDGAPTASLFFVAVANLLSLLIFSWSISRLKASCRPCRCVMYRMTILITVVWRVLHHPPAEQALLSRVCVAPERARRTTQWRLGGVCCLV